MDAVDALVRLGGVARGDAVIALSSRKRLRTAVAAGRIRRVGRNGFALPDAEAGRAALRLHGARSHLSAAAHHGWEVAWPAERPHVTVPRGRNVSPERRRGVSVHWRPLTAAELEHAVTDPVRTVLDCAALLPPDQALAVADSALRQGDVTREGLVAGTPSRGPNAARIATVVARADGRSANPFESVLRHLALEAGLDVVPQHAVEVAGAVLHPDLVDVRRRLVIEADSWEWHATREAHERDCRRYNALVLAGWTVLRFTWSDVMRMPTQVLALLTSLAGGVRPAGAPRGRGG